MPIIPDPLTMNATLISPAEVNALAFITPINSALILPEIIAAAETRYLVPVITQLVYEDIFVNPAFYESLLKVYIKPYLAFCVKLLCYTQYLTESTLLTVPFQQRWDMTEELLWITKTKRRALFDHLDASRYPLYAAPLNGRISGFIVN